MIRLLPILLVLFGCAERSDLEHGPTGPASAGSAAAAVAASPIQVARPARGPLPAPATEQCSNGSDDDSDGLVDCEDADCVSDAHCVEACDDELDNDLDGLADCEDDECWGRCVRVQVRVMGSGPVLVRNQRYARAWGHSYGIDGRATSSVTGVLASAISGQIRIEPLDGDGATDCTWTVEEVSFGRIWTNEVDYLGSWSSSSIVSSSAHTLLPAVRWGFASSGACPVDPQLFLPGALMTTARWGFGMASGSHIAGRRWYLGAGPIFDTVSSTGSSDGSFAGGGWHASRGRHSALHRGSFGPGSPRTTTVALP